ncbi:hypothetical protein MO973_30880 [Paenibacillus sp. TRM 82003]|uniref:hypothetical protein n=1 Tax=Kineococcus sp. TRM81007 TaxID=2925831 RepID=UPI001F5A0DFF|nr:hypothetical protein [Kineococcus sp. TRM81007]MCI2237898.1 hypothetical protein [Kineococcus sp. TRM81007]MCI3924628.1 hypothetical protein [Paenibacillus sp. TRM 82003]
MRWDDLFEDLDARLAHVRRLEQEAEVADRRVADLAAVDLLGRLLAGDGELSVQLPDGGWVSGRVRAAGPGWLLLVTGPPLRRQVLVPTAAVCALRGLSPRSVQPGAVVARRTLGMALRALSAARVEVLVRTRAADVRGRLVRVGADHVDVVVPGQDPQAVVTVPFASVLNVTDLG